MNWEFTGNHYLALPWIAPANGSIHGVNAGHRGMSALVSWTGEDRGSGEGRPLLRIGVSVEGLERPLARLRWERLDRWIPRFTADLGDGFRLVVTYCAPGGFDPLVRGAVIHTQLSNGTGRDTRASVWLEGCWGWTLRTIATTRPLGGTHRLARGQGPDGLTLEVGEAPNGAALGVVVAAPSPIYEAGAGSDLGPIEPGGEITRPVGTPIAFRVSAEKRLNAASRTSVSFILSAALERDGALETAARLCALGGEELTRRGRLDLASLNRTADDGVARDMLSRNMVFHHYYGAVRAIDDDRIYPVQSRSPEFGPCAVFGEREALAWSLPAYVLTDPMLSRELLMRALEVWSDRAGTLRRYLDGGVVDGAFSLGRLCDWVLAIDRYTEITRDDGFADEPLVQQLLREIDDAVYARLHPEIFLGSTEVLPGGERADYPWCAFDNVLVWRLCRALDRLWRAHRDAPPAQDVPRLRNGADEIEAAIWQRCTIEVEGLQVIACTSDLQGNAAVYDDPAGSLRLLPYYGFCAADDPIWSNTMELLHSTSYPLWHGRAAHPGLASRSRPSEASFAALCADLFGPRRNAALELVRRLALPGDVPCTTFDPQTGRAASGPYAATLAGWLVQALLHGTDAKAPMKKAER
jgi:hypothetical protein